MSSVHLNALTPEPPAGSVLTQDGCLFCRDLKKQTGDWFYDQRVNRFSALPGHDLVKTSLKKKVQCKRAGGWAARASWLCWSGQQLWARSHL